MNQYNHPWAVIDSRYRVLAVGDEEDMFRLTIAEDDWFPDDDISMPPTKLEKELGMPLVRFGNSFPLRTSQADLILEALKQNRQCYVDFQRFPITIPTDETRTEFTTAYLQEPFVESVRVVG